MKMQAKRILVHIIVILLVIAGLAAALYYDAYYAAPSRYLVRYENLSSVFIPSQMDDVSILFFSDLDYGTFMNEARLNKLNDTINDLSPDVIVFGGDLLDQTKNSLLIKEREALVRGLSTLRAPLGKFAVLGDFDQMNQERSALVQEILFESDFELLLNSSVLIRNGGSGSITLTGIDSGLYGSPDIETAFTNVGRAVFNIAVCHTPDIADHVPVDRTNYMLAGHSHGGQAYWGFSALYTPPLAEVYFRGKHSISDYFTLDISNGVGTTIEDVRFLANAEVVLLRLHHKAMTEE